MLNSKFINDEKLSTYKMVFVLIMIFQGFENDIQNRNFCRRQIQKQKEKLIYSQNMEKKWYTPCMMRIDDFIYDAELKSCLQVQAHNPQDKDSR